MHKQCVSGHERIQVSPPLPIPKALGMGDRPFSEPQNPPTSCRAPNLLVRGQAVAPPKALGDAKKIEKQHQINSMYSNLFQLSIIKPI